MSQKNAQIEFCCYMYVYGSVVSVISGICWGFAKYFLEQGKHHVANSEFSKPWWPLLSLPLHCQWPQPYWVFPHKHQMPVASSWCTVPQVSHRGLLLLRVTGVSVLCRVGARFSASVNPLGVGRCSRPSCTNSWNNAAFECQHWFWHQPNKNEYNLLSDHIPSKASVCFVWNRVVFEITFGSLHDHDENILLYTRSAGPGNH